MQTINISVTDEQRRFVDELVNTLGFANRSELFRTVIRKIKAVPVILEEPKAFKLSSKKIKKYDQMLDDIESGREELYTTNSVADLTDHLYGSKSKVKVHKKVSKKLQKKNRTKT